MQLLAIDFGTFCDFKIMQAVILEFIRCGHTVFYLTEESNRQWAVEHSVVPLCFQYPDGMRAAMQSMANEMTDYTLSFRKRIVIWETVMMLRLIRNIGKMLDHVLALHNFNAILFHYPALVLHKAIPHKVLERTPVAVMYVAPAFPNSSVPWLFSSSVKNNQLYDRTNDGENLKEHQNVLRDMSRFRGQSGRMSLSSKYLQEAFTGNTFHALASWDPKALAPIRSVIPYTSAGAILDRKLIENVLLELSGRKMKPSIYKPSHELARFIRRSHHLVYLSLGTFSIDVSAVLEAMTVIAAQFKISLIYHDINKLASSKLVALSKTHGSFLYILQDHLPHEWLVPRCAAVMTTGSVCLANICMFCRVPLIIIPVLNEQFFWAKNYEHFTDVHPLDLILMMKDAPTYEALVLAIQQELYDSFDKSFRSKAVKKYLRTVISSMAKLDGCQMIRVTLEKMVARFKQ